jgi:hypothetical protein
MVNGAYLQLERETTVTGWPLPSGTNRRCYLFESALPSNPSNQYFGSAVCTPQDLLDLLNAAKTFFGARFKRFMCVLRLCL